MVQLNTTKNGVHSPKDLKNICKILSNNPNPKELQNILELTEHNKNTAMDMIDFEECGVLMEKYLNYAPEVLDELTNAFKTLDYKNEGRVSIKEIKAAMERQKQALNEEEVKEIFLTYGFTEDSYISYEEFMAFFIS